MQIPRSVTVLTLHRVKLVVLLLRLLWLLLLLPLIAVSRLGVRFAGLVGDTEESAVFDSVFDEAHVDLIWWCCCGWWI